MRMPHGEVMEIGDTTGQDTANKDKKRLAKTYGRRRPSEHRHVATTRRHIRDVADFGNGKVPKLAPPFTANRTPG